MDTANESNSSTLVDVKFLTPNLGYAVGAQGVVVRTTNGGTTWDLQGSGNTLFLGSIHLI